MDGQHLRRWGAFAFAASAVMLSSGPENYPNIVLAQSVPEASTSPTATSDSPLFLGWPDLRLMPNQRVSMRRMVNITYPHHKEVDSLYVFAGPRNAVGVVINFNYEAAEVRQDRKVWFRVENGEPLNLKENPEDHQFVSPSGDEEKMKQQMNFAVSDLENTDHQSRRLIKLLRYPLSYVRHTLRIEAGVAKLADGANSEAAAMRGIFVFE